MLYTSNCHFCKLMFFVYVWKMWMVWFLYFEIVNAISFKKINLTVDYFKYKDVRHVCYFSCDTKYHNQKIANNLIKNNIRVSIKQLNGVSGSEHDSNNDMNINKFLQQWTYPIGVLLGTCNETSIVLDEASKSRLFDATHSWLILSNTDNANETNVYIEQKFQHLNLSVDADIVVASENDAQHKLIDVFNYGKIQGNDLETAVFGMWDPANGLNIMLKGFKYYHRWDFHNLTLRAVSVVRNKPKNFDPSQLSDLSFNQDISAMTKISSQVLMVIKDLHNFRYNYTILDRWVGSPKRNSIPAVTNTLFWREQDISMTCTRIFPTWLDWIDPIIPPATQLQTKFFYLIPQEGVGALENRFLTPLDPGVWWCTLGLCVICGILLALAMKIEKRESPGVQAFFSIVAAIGQQSFEGGSELKCDAVSIQAGKLSLLMLGFFTMIVYNFYTSSVVSWLLIAAPPNIKDLDGLMKSDLEVIFEEIGYTKQWLDNPGFYYYSGFKTPQEDEFRDKKVNIKHKSKLFQTVYDGVKLVQGGGYAYHTEPYTAGQVISRYFLEKELCELGTLQMMKSSHVYIQSQKQGPYRQFFSWSLLRLAETGHLRASQIRFSGNVPPCSGVSPRALALGQAAPAFILLAQAIVFCLFMLGLEIAWHSCPSIFMNYNNTRSSPTISSSYQSNANYKLNIATTAAPSTYTPNVTQYPMLDGYYEYYMFR